MGAEGVSGTVDLAALGARARVRGAHAHHVKLARHCRESTRYDRIRELHFFFADEETREKRASAMAI